jgi:hypothetical protein
MIGGYAKMRAMFCGTFLAAKRLVFIPQVHPVPFLPLPRVFRFWLHTVYWFGGLALDSGPIHPLAP